MFLLLLRYFQISASNFYFILSIPLTSHPPTPIFPGMQRICEVLEEQEREILNEDKDPLCLSESEGTVDSTDEVIFVSHHQEPTSSGSSSLGDLIGLLQQQMRSSDWLQKNTVEQFAQEKPEVYDVFSKLVGKK